MNVLAENLPWVQALGWSLLHFVWQGLLIGILFAFARALVPGENSSVRYAIGLAALVMLALCPPLTLWVLWPQIETASTGTLAAAALMPVDSVELAVTSVSDSFLGDLLPALVLGWLAGVFLMVGRAVHQWRALERIATRLAHQCDEIDAMLMRVAARVGEVPGVRVLVSAFIDTPTLIGWFKPVILLPAAVVARFPREQLELILAHELGHLRRYDHLVNLGQAIIETVLFYHPVVHWISREVRNEREICCDNLVLQMTRSEPRDYARTLAALENARQLTPQLAVAASGGMLVDRVRRIVGAPPRAHAGKHAVIGTWLSATAAMIALIATLMAAQSHNDDAWSRIDQPEPPPVLVNLSIPQQLGIQDPAVTVRFAELSMPGGVDEKVSRTVPEQASSNSAALSEPQSADATALPAPPIVLPAPDRGILLEPADITLAEVAAPEPSEPAVGVHGSPALPALLRMVAPSYPDSSREAAHVKVGFEFSIDDTGKVRDINLVSGDMDSDFAESARRALRQWRFDPDSRQLATSEKYRQDFEFVGEALAEETHDDSECVPRTGSHVCRPVRSSSSAHMENGGNSATAAHMVVLAGRGSH